MKPEPAFLFHSAFRPVELDTGAVYVLHAGRVSELIPRAEHYHPLADLVECIQRDGGLLVDGPDLILTQDDGQELRLRYRAGPPLPGVLMENFERSLRADYFANTAPNWRVVYGSPE